MVSSEITEVKVNGRMAKVKFISREKNIIKISVDEKEYTLDVAYLEEGLYSFLLGKESFNIEMLKGKNAKNYIVTVDTLYNSYEVEIIDAESKYQQNRKKTELGEDTAKISSPMPGKVAKIPVKVGDKLKAGETAIVVEAMKMQSEYKVKKDRVVKEILVKEGDIVDGNQPLIIVE